MKPQWYGSSTPETAHQFNTGFSRKVNEVNHKTIAGVWTLASQDSSWASPISQKHTLPGLLCTIRDIYIHLCAHTLQKRYWSVCGRLKLSGRWASYSCLALVLPMLCTLCTHTNRREREERRWEQRDKKARWTNKCKQCTFLILWETNYHGFDGARRRTSEEEKKMSRNYSSRINQPLKLQLVFREEMLSFSCSFLQKENKSFMLLLIKPV